MGELFKSLHKFDEASHCYEKAANLASGSHESETVNRELARLLTAQGDYPEALKAFKRLRENDNSIYTQTSMATVLRKMGSLQSARQLYESVYLENKSHHQALVGLAEINRQKGRFRKAITKYETAIGMLSHDADSAKIYRCALSSLHCATGRYDEAESLLRELLQQYGNDWKIQLSLAKVLRLEGKLLEAGQLYRDSFLSLIHI